MARGNCRLCGIAMEEPTRLRSRPTDLATAAAIRFRLRPDRRVADLARAAGRSAQYGETGPKDAAMARALQAQEDLRRRERAATIDHLNALRHWVGPAAAGGCKSLTIQGRFALGPGIRIIEAKPRPGVGDPVQNSRISNQKQGIENAPDFRCRNQVPKSGAKASTKG
jgi:hypothetical protein